MTHLRTSSHENLAIEGEWNGNINSRTSGTTDREQESLQNANKTLTQRLHNTLYKANENDYIIYRLNAHMEEPVKLEKRISRNTRKINSVARRVDMLREEVDTLIQEIDELTRRLEIAWEALRIP